MVICNKQHLSNIFSSIHEKMKPHRGGAEKKKRYLYKKVCFIIVIDGIYCCFLIFIKWIKKVFDNFICAIINSLLALFDYITVYALLVQAMEL